MDIIRLDDPKVIIVHDKEGQLCVFSQSQIDKKRTRKKSHVYG